MFPPDHATEFTRDTGGTEAEWLGRLPGACASHPCICPAPGRAVVQIGAGQLQLDWAMLPPRQIALIRLPRLLVHYRFDGVDATVRREFMRYFDLYMQRGGG
ncbi:MAG: hypothetical protein AB3X44_12345 [Leptothrix sp. (in: b-proteobacteria)]